MNAFSTGNVYSLAARGEVGVAGIRSFCLGTIRLVRIRVEPVATARYNLTIYSYARPLDQVRMVLSTTPFGRRVIPRTKTAKVGQSGNVER